VPLTLVELVDGLVLEEEVEGVVLLIELDDEGEVADVEGDVAELVLEAVFDVLLMLACAD
jgi:hypothetical protein